MDRLDLVTRAANLAALFDTPSHLFALLDALEEYRNPLRALLAREAVHFQRNAVLEHPEMLGDELQSAHFC